MAPPRTQGELAQSINVELPRLCGAEIASPAVASLKIARYRTGGMSGGLVAPAVWQQRLVPMLVSRYFIDA